LYHTEYLYKELNVLPVKKPRKKLFYKASVIYIIKNNPNPGIEHGYNTVIIYLSQVAVFNLIGKLEGNNLLYILYLFYRSIEL